MAERSRGMGRGLSALLAPPAADGEARAQELREIPVDLIVPNPTFPTVDTAPAVDRA